MKLSTFLQAFLIFDVFIMGALAATALRHAYAHFRPTHPEAEKKHKPTAPELSAAARQRMLEAAEADFQSALHKAVGQLQNDMVSTAERINKLLENLGTEIIGDELDNYKSELEHLRKQAVADVEGIKTGIAQHETELKAQLDTEIAKEKERVINQIDTKLADAVSAFLIETLQHNVDLGAQSDYLSSMLEEHKEDFKKRVADETPAG